MCPVVNQELENGLIEALHEKFCRVSEIFLFRHPLIKQRYVISPAENKNGALTPSLGAASGGVGAPKRLDAPSAYKSMATKTLQRSKRGGGH